jgi:maleylacetate reductase
MEKVQAVSFHYTDLETVHSGVEYGECLALELQQRNLQRALVLVSSSLRKASSELESLTRAAGDRLVAISDAVGAHSPRPDVMQLVQLARDTEADVLISIGGGSVIDACKAAQLALDQGVRSEEQLLAYAQAADGSRGPRAGTVQHPAADYPLRQIAVPTTLSGAEYSNNAGILNPQLAAKEGYRAPGLCPQVIIYDPRLATFTPQWLWLSTAIRSLDHAVEGLASDDCHPYLAGHFLHALRQFAASLPSMKADPQDLAARQHNQQAVWLACCGLGTVAHGASHGIGYILGSYCGVPHGLTSCVMLPAVLAWNRSVQPVLDRDIASALGFPELTASEALYRLLNSLELPCSLSAVGVETAELQEIARRASLHPVVRRNPRPIENPAQVEEILQLAWRGQPV